MRAPRFIPSKGHWYYRSTGYVYMCHLCSWRWSPPGCTRSAAIRKGEQHHRMQHRR